MSSPSNTFYAALTDYVIQTGVDPTEHPFSEKLEACRSANAVLELLQDKAEQFKEYRDGNIKLIDFLSPIVQTLYVLSGVLHEAAMDYEDGFLPFQSVQSIFVCIDVLLDAAIEVEGSYDAILDFFEPVANFLGRLRIYAKIPYNPAMYDTVVKILVEILSVLALATNQIKQGQFKKFAKKLLGESDVEAVLQRLDRLTLEDARMTAAQTLAVVHGLINNMRVVLDDGKAPMDDIRYALVAMQDITSNTNKMKRDQFQRDIRSWLSPPDPSKNHNIAWKAHYDGSASWFTQGSIFEEWKSTGSLLWIHGKPGSGKTILCSSIIQELKAMCDAGLALVSYYYFDFKDIAKQDIRGLVTSLLAQLCAQSDSCYDVLSKMYLEDLAGSLPPDNHALMKCLVKILQLPRQPTIYIIVDALDECPKTARFIKTRRDEVLDLLEELVNLNLPNLHICVTGHPDIDIRNVLEPLASHHISLHDESGQKKDILDYITTAVRADPNMQRWRLEDKQLIINTLSAKVDGMFRWVVYQLDMLHRCPPAALQSALEELPDTLDETYKRILLGIEEVKREAAHRMFQCLAVSARPLRVEELAELLAIRFDSGNLPQYHIDWRLEDPHEAVLSPCSSLVVIINVEGPPIVQFSHFSVMQFLTSHRLVQAAANLSRYHIVPISAHTILAQASLSVLLYLGNLVDKNNIKDFPFAIYAARHWVDHGRFGDVSSKIQDAMVRLFGLDNPSFATWIWIYDIDYPHREHMTTTQPTRPAATPLYYATLCGFRDLVEHLLVTHPGDVNARGGYHTTPLHAALAKGYVDIAVLLLGHGADVDALNGRRLSALHISSGSGHHDNVEFLLKHHADPNTMDGNGDTPLTVASCNGDLEVARVLLGHGAGVDSRNNKGWSPLFAASRYGHLDIVRLLIRCGAHVDTRENDGWTPLFVASRCGYLDIVRLLIESGAVVDCCQNEGWTPLFAASRYGHLDIARFLIENAATMDSRDNKGCTPLFAASRYGHSEIVRWLIQGGATVDPRENQGWTPLLAASRYGHLDIVRLLITSGAAVDSRENQGWTPLMSASRRGHLEIAQELLDQNADVNEQETDLRTPLHLASANGHLTIATLLIQHGAEIDKESAARETPLYQASSNGHLEIARLLIKSGSNPKTQNHTGSTPLHDAAYHGHLDIVKLLFESGADLDVTNADDKSPYDLASANGKLEVARFLVVCVGEAVFWDDIHLTQLDHGSQKSPSDAALSTPGRVRTVDVSENLRTLYTASREGNLLAVQSLLGYGVDADGRVANHETPLCVASMHGRFEVAKVLAENGADVNSRDKNEWTPLHRASQSGHLDIVQLLLDHGADVNAKDQHDWSPLHLASLNGHMKIAHLLRGRGAN